MLQPLSTAKTDSEASQVADKPVRAIVAPRCQSEAGSRASCALLPLLSRLSSLSIVPAADSSCSAADKTDKTRSSLLIQSSSSGLIDLQLATESCDSSGSDHHPDNVSVQQQQLCQRYALAARRESAAAASIAAFCSRRHQQLAGDSASDPLRRIAKPPRLLRRPNKRRRQHQQPNLQHRQLHCQLTRSATCTILVSTTAIAELLLSNQYLAQLSAAWIRDRSIRLFSSSSSLGSAPARLALEAPPRPAVQQLSSSASTDCANVECAPAVKSSTQAASLPSAASQSSSGYSTERCRLVGDAYPDLTVYELASYFDELVRLPKKMSSQAESMYL